MAKKKFETVAYDPIEAEHRRSLSKQVTSTNYEESRVDSPPPARHVPGPSIEDGLDSQPTPVRDQVVAMPRTLQREESRLAPFREERAPRKEKKRSFTCASREQDRELDTFLKRLADIADTGVPFQVLLRAACVCVMRAEEQIIAEMRKKSPPVKPATFDHADYALFEEYWTDILGAALRKVRPLQATG